MTTTRYTERRSPYEGRRYVDSYDYEPGTAVTTTAATTTYYDDGTTGVDARRRPRVVTTDAYGNHDYVRSDRSGRVPDYRDRGTHDKTNATFLDKLRDLSGIEGQPRRGRNPAYELPRDRIADKYGDPVVSPRYEEVGEPRYDPNPYGELNEDRTRNRRYGDIAYDGKVYRDPDYVGTRTYDNPNYPYGEKRRRKREDIAKIDHERGFDHHSQGGRHGMDKSLGGLFGGSYYDSLRDDEGYLPDDPNRPVNPRYGDRAVVGDRAFHDSKGAYGDAGAKHVGRRHPRVVHGGHYDRGYGGRSGYGTRYESHDHYREYKESSRKRNPLSDVGETDKYWIVRCELPGVRESDVTVTVEGKDLIIRGVRVKDAWNHDKYESPGGTITTTTTTGTGATTSTSPAVTSTPTEGGTATTTKVDWADRETGSRKGKFKRKVRLPARVDQSAIQSSISHGILEVVVKKPAEYLFNNNKK